jgi:transcriptional regulator with XRE-family HTH domain
MMHYYPLAKKISMILHAKGWSQTRLATEIGVTPRYVYDMLHGSDGKRRHPPKGAEEIDRLFRKLFPEPFPSHLQELSDQIGCITQLCYDKERRADELAVRG